MAVRVEFATLDEDRSLRLVLQLISQGRRVFSLLVPGRSTMLPLLFFVCLLPFLVTNALLIARLALNTLRARYGPLWPSSKSQFATLPRPSTMQRLVSYLLSVTNPPDDVDRTEDALDDKPTPIAVEVASPGVKQPLEYLLAFDVEATCVQGTRLELCLWSQLTPF